MLGSGNRAVGTMCEIQLSRCSASKQPAGVSGALQRRDRPSTDRGLTLRSSRLAAVRWSGASAPRASQLQVSVWSAREGRERLSERTLGRAKGTDRT